MIKTLIAVAALCAAMLLGVSGGEAHGRHSFHRGYGWHHHGFHHHRFYGGYRHHWGHRRFGWHHRHHAEALDNPAAQPSGQPPVALGGTSGGMASWYQGRTGGFTAAHKYWPFGTRVLVTNRSNGRSVVVRINDRGPFVRGRVIDLNRASAAAIGVTGVSPVTLQRL